MNKFLFFFVLLNVNLVISQTNKVLSNKEYLYLQEESRRLLNSNRDSSFVLANKIEASNSFLHKAFAKGIKSYLFQLNGDSLKSKEELKKGILYLNKQNNSIEKKKIESYLLNYEGLSEWQRGNLSKALICYLKGKKISDKISDKLQSIKFNNNIAYIYGEMGQYELAIKLSKHSDSLTDKFSFLYKLSKYRDSKALVNGHIGVFYEEMYLENKKSIYLDSAEYYYNKAKIYSEKGNILNTDAKINLARVYYKKKEFEKAEKMYSSLLSDSNLTKDDLKYLNINLGELYLYKKQYYKALSCFQKVDLFNTKSNDFDVFLKYSSSFFQSKTYFELKDYVNANKKAKEFIEIHEKHLTKFKNEVEKCNNISITKKNKDVEEIYKISKREILISRMSYASILLILVIIIIFLIIRNHKKKVINKKIMKLIEDSKSNYEVTTNLKTEEPKEITLNLDEKTEETIFLKLNEMEKNKDYLKSDFTLLNVSKKIKTNTTYLSYVVNKKFGKSFSEYSNELKMRFVINELINNATFRKYSTQAIAESVGFKNANSFTLSFKKRTGVTPAQFIQKINSNQHQVE